jgi:hypothetical protein
MGDQNDFWLLLATLLLLIFILRIGHNYLGC